MSFQLRTEEVKNEYGDLADYHSILNKCNLLSVLICKCMVLMMLGRLKYLQRDEPLVPLPSSFGLI